MAAKSSTSCAFDCNVMLGPTSTRLGGAFSTPGALIAEMDRLGIAEALVHHALSKELHAPTGNAALLMETEAEPRLHPCWVLLPIETGELGEEDPEGFVQSMLGQGVRAARVFPTIHRFNLAEWCIGGLLCALERYRVPLFLDFDVKNWADPSTDWDAVYQVCRDHPELPVIVVHESIAAPRRLYPLWRRVDNLYLETVYYQVHRGFHDIAERFGPERVLFGTGMPMSDPGPPLAMALYSEISDTDKELVLGGNLRRLLADVRWEQPEAPKRPEAPIRIRSIPRSRIEDWHVIDAHGHVGAWPSTYVAFSDPESMLVGMDRARVERCCISSFYGIGPDCERGNREVAEVLRRYPERFLGYATVNPNYPEHMTKELERCFDEWGMTAIKFHCDFHQYPVDGENYAGAFEFADERGLAILIHGYGSNAMWEGLLAKYPKVKILQAHVGGGWDGRSPMPVLEIARKYDRFYLDLASSPMYRGGLKRVVEFVGADQIVHGSDTPLLDVSYQLGQVLYAELGDEDKQKILHDNAVRLFGL